jgi:hypothetical protein
MGGTLDPINKKDLDILLLKKEIEDLDLNLAKARILLRTCQNHIFNKEHPTEEDHKLHKQIEKFL